MHPTEQAAKHLHARLGVAEHLARCYVVYRQRKQGWRVTVIRLSDGLTATTFVKEAA